jgi:cytochrome c-type biogenesis protein CcmH/NrfF
MTRTTRRIPKALKIGVLAATLMSTTVPVFAQSAKTQLTDPELSGRFNEVSEKLVCQCGCNEQLSVCSMQDCGSATPMRQEIERQLTAGQTNDDIVKYFVDKDGLKILSSPPAEGINLAAWVMPGFALLIGLAFVMYMAARWAAKRRMATAGGGPVEVDPEMRRRIEEELKNRSWKQ